MSLQTMESVCADYELIFLNQYFLLVCFVSFFCFVAVPAVVAFFCGGYCFSLNNNFLQSYVNFPISNKALIVIIIKVTSVNS